MTYLIVHPDNHDKLTAVKAVLKALKVDFDEAKTKYNPEFVAKMAEGEDDIKSGNTVKVAKYRTNIGVLPKFSQV